MSSTRVAIRAYSSPSKASTDRANPPRRGFWPRRSRQEGRDVAADARAGRLPGAEEIRALVLQGEPDRWSAETELLLFTAARRDHVERTIAPALEAGKVVICDRFADSTRVYQGATRGDLRVQGRHAARADDRARAGPDLPHRHGSRHRRCARASERVGSEDRFENFGHRTAGDAACRVSRPCPLARRFRVLAGNRPEAGGAYRRDGLCAPVSRRRVMSDPLPEPDRVDGAPHPRETMRLIGQDAAERDFLDAYAGDRLHHAWLITGPEGVGKATLAWRIATVPRGDAAFGGRGASRHARATANTRHRRRSPGHAPQPRAGRAVDLPSAPRSERQGRPDRRRYPRRRRARPQETDGALFGRRGPQGRSSWTLRTR